MVRYGHISTWNTSRVMSKRKLFQGRKEFNGDISQ
ncbi:BspA family leucine-rich repeat surface protein [archaeon]|nr:MAG: BspA family leucine-rich repeat surface protein [archaeon]